MKTQKRSITSLLVGVASLVLIVAGLKAMSGLLSPILLSLFIVLVTYPIMTWLKRRGFPYWLAYTIVLFIVLSVGAFFVLFFTISLEQLSGVLPNYVSQTETQLNNLWQWLNERGVESKDIQSLQWFQPERIIRLVLSLISSLLGIFSNIGLTLLIFIYMLASAPTFAKQLRRGLGNNNLLGQFYDFAHSTSSYLAIKSWVGALTAICQIILMWIMGVNFAVLWGVLSFLFNFVPNIGFYIALIPPVLLTLLNQGLWQAVILGVIYALINNFFDIVVAPRFLAKGLDLSVLVTFLAVIIWTWILGPIGAFMALPLTVMVKKLLLEPFPQTQLVATLLGSGEEETTKQGN